MRDERLHELPRILAVLDEVADAGQGSRRVPVGDEIDHLEDQVGLDLPQHLRQLLVRYEPARQVRYLVHHADRVADGSVRMLGDHGHRLTLDLYPLA